MQSAIHLRRTFQNCSRISRTTWRHQRAPKSVNHVVFFFLALFSPTLFCFIASDAVSVANCYQPCFRPSLWRGHLTHLSHVSMLLTCHHKHISERMIRSFLSYIIASPFQCMLSSRMQDALTNAKLSLSALLSLFGHIVSGEYVASQVELSALMTLSMSEHQHLSIHFITTKVGHIF